MGNRSRFNARAVDRKCVQRALRFIRQDVTRSRSASMLGLGQFLLEQFFDGRPEHYRDRSCRSKTFEALCAEQEELQAMGFKRTTLHNCIRICIQQKELPEAQLGDLPYSAQVALLPAPPAVKQALARRALAESISVRAIKEEIKEHKRSGDETRACKPKLHVIRAVDQAGAAMRRIDDQWFNELQGVSEADLASVLETLDQLSAELTAIRSQVQLIQALRRPRPQADGASATDSSSSWNIVPCS